MNRRSFIAGVSLLACGSRAALAGNTFEALQPVDSLRRDFLNGKVDVPADEVRSLVSCAYDMRSEAEAGSAIELLIASAQDSMGFEISIGETTAIPVASPEASTSGWFVTYPTWAGAAAFYQEHARGIFAIGKRVFDVALAGLDRVLLASELMVQVEGIRGRSGSLADVLPSAADVPEELDFYGEQRPDGTFDAEENRSEDADSWWVNPMNIVGMSI